MANQDDHNKKVSFSTWYKEKYGNLSIFSQGLRWFLLGLIWIPGLYLYTGKERGGLDSSSKRMCIVTICVSLVVGLMMNGAGTVPKEPVVNKQQAVKEQKETEKQKEIKAASSYEKSENFEKKCGFYSELSDIVNTGINTCKEGEKKCSIFAEEVANKDKFEYSKRLNSCSLRTAVCIEMTRDYDSELLSMRAKCLSCLAQARHGDKDYCINKYGRSLWGKGPTY